MPSYNLYSLDGEVFTQLTTSPTMEQALLLADALLEELDHLLSEHADEVEAENWPTEREALAEWIHARLAASDWYSDLSYGSATVWDAVLEALKDEAGKGIGIDFRCENDGYLDMDTVQLAAEQGATLLDVSHFGHGAFRYFPDQSIADCDPIYSLHTSEMTRELLAQLEAVSPYFMSLPEGEATNRHYFFKGLLEPVRSVAAEGRVLWVQTDM